MTHQLPTPDHIEEIDRESANIRHDSSFSDDGSTVILRSRQRSRLPRPRPDQHRHILFDSPGLHNPRNLSNKVGRIVRYIPRKSPEKAT